MGLGGRQLLGSDWAGQCEDSKASDPGPGVADGSGGPIGIAWSAVPQLVRKLSAARSG